MRELLLLRHAKSDWDQRSPAGEPLPDHERVLAPRGVRDAVAAGLRLADIGWPELVVCSTARRTRETWAYATRDHEVRSEVRYDRAVYGATATELRQLTGELEVDPSSLLIIGHGPGLPQLAAELAGGALRDPYKTAGLARFRIGGGWDDLGGPELVSYELPRG